MRIALLGLAAVVLAGAQTACDFTHGFEDRLMACGGVKSTCLTTPPTAKPQSVALPPSAPLRTVAVLAVHQSTAAAAAGTSQGRLRLFATARW